MVGSGMTAVVAAAAAAMLTAANTAQAAPAAANPLSNIQHIVLFMQENRAFDHYFGTMAGVRGFKDPNVVISSNTKQDAFHQQVDSTVEPAPPAGVTVLQPWWINAAGGDSLDRYQCMLAGSNGWQENHAAWNKGNVDRWAINNTAYSLGYYTRKDLPFHYALADAYTVGDAYHESVIAATDPNRVSWGSGTNGIAQYKAGLGGPVVDNNASPGCESSPGGPQYSCYPFKWKTVPEYLQEAGITFFSYQNEDNFGDNPFAYFEQYQTAPNNSALVTNANSFAGLQKFYDDAKAGTLPQVSYIVGPTDLSEHPPFGPLDGAWLQQQVVNAVVNGKNYDSTALLISYDETGGWGDHVMAPHPPTSETDEYMIDPFDPSLGNQPNGPGFRLPFTIVSPWTRSGGVFTETSAHESQILFLEQWAKAIGKPFTSKEMTPWRRSQLSDLTRAFDFSKADTSKPSLPTIRKASQDANGQYNGASVCLAKYGNVQPTVPYSTTQAGPTVEKGFKPIRGTPTEGRYLTIETDKVLALSYDAKATALTVSPAKPDHSDPLTRFVLHAASVDANNQLFTIATASSTPVKYIAKDLSLTATSSNAGVFKMQDQANGKGYLITETSSNKPVNVQMGKASLGAAPAKIEIFSVTF